MAWRASQYKLPGPADVLDTDLKTNQVEQLLYIQLASKSWLVSAFGSRI